MDRRTFLKSAATWSTPASGSSHGGRRPFGETAIDMAKRLCMIRVPRRAWLVGLGLAVGIILTTGGSATADPPKPSCTPLTTEEGTVFEILNNQTYALCAVSHCFVFNEVAYCKCDVEFGESVSLALEYDKDKNVCTINEKGVKKGLYDKHFQRAPVEPPAHSDDVGRAFRLISATCSDRSRPAVPIDVGRGGGAPAGRY